jgi:WD40 repeat protein
LFASALIAAFGPGTPALVAQGTGPPGQVRRHDWDYAHVYHSAFSLDGRLYAAGGDSNCVRVWNSADGKQLDEFHHADWITQIAFTPDGGRLLTGSKDGTVHLWDLATSEELRKFEGLLSATLSPDGATVLSSLPGGGVRWWNLTTGNELHKFVAAD